MFKEFIKRTIQSTGYDVVRHRGDEAEKFPTDIQGVDRGIIEEVKPYTLTSNERLISLTRAVRFVARNNIPGAIAECGVWRGGSMMAVALTLIDEGDTSRDLFLYDTYEGMPDPTDADKRFDGRPAELQLAETPPGEGVWCRSSLDEVKSNMASTGYPSERIRYIPGKVEETIPARIPPKLALLRLDTDWYESTKHELDHLFPLLVQGGFLIVDDYGHWQGARKAVDEFLASRSKKYFLHRLDNTGRLLIK
jgi:O-methyltransferase